MLRTSHTLRGSLSVLLVLGILGSLIVPGVSASIPDTATSSAPLANDLRISQVYGGGGGAGYYLYDYVELFNAGTSSIDLTGYSLQYGSATGQFASTSTNLYAFPAGTTVAAEKYLLVQLGAAGTSGLALPTTPDLVTTNLAMSQSSGKVALANINTALGCGATATPCSLPDARIVDLAAWGTSNNAEGGVTINNGVALTNQQGGVRKSAGCQDTDHNGNDFDVLSGSALVPRNSSSPANPCGGGDVPPIVVSTTPTNGATGVPVDAVVSTTFSEPVTVSGTIAIDCTSGLQNVTPTGGPTTFTLPHSNFAPGDFCTVTILGNQVTDLDGTPTNMAENYVWSFTVASACGGPATAIHDIQGSGLTSPLLNTAQTIEAVVVSDLQAVSTIRGFFVQENDADIDADPATSEGLFIYDNNFGVNVAVGDLVRVSGTVTEFQEQTELGSVNAVTVCPTPQPATPVQVTLPFPNTTYVERFEGMSVVMTQTLTVNETFNLGRGAILTLSNGRLQQPTNVVLPGAPANALQAQNNLNQITLDDSNLTQNPDPIVYPPPGLTALNTVRSGDSVSNLAGVLTQGNPGWTTPGNIYRINPHTMPTFTATNPRPAAPDPVRLAGGSLKISSFNVLNYFLTLDTTNTPPFPCGPDQNQECRGANTAQELTRQRDKLLQALYTLNADVVGLMELENTPNVEPLQDIVNGLNALAGAGTYSYINTGTINPGDVIKVGIIYKPGVVQPAGNFAILNYLVDPTFTSINRPALAQTFEQPATHGRFTIIVNHLKSKGCTGAGGLDLDQGDGQSCFNYTRTQAANALINWALSDPTGSNDPDVLIVGDLNSYAREDPIRALETAGYTNLETTFVGAGAYSYVFASQAGSLDHSMANASLISQVNGATTWHINADEPTVLDYNTEFKTANQINILYNADAYRTSDHDPLLIGLNLTPTVADMWVSKIDGPDPVGLGETLTYTITSQNNGPDTAYDVVITDTLPGGLAFIGAAAYTGTCSEVGGVVTCDMGDMNDGDIQSVVISATVAEAGCGAVITNQVEVASATFDDNLANNSAEQDTTVSCLPPNIVVDPLAVSSTQATNVQTQHTLTISNTGQANLEWEIFEEPQQVAGPASPLPLVPFDAGAALADEITGVERAAPVPLEAPDPAARARAKRALMTTGLLLVPDSTNDRVMALDPITGNVIDANFVPTNNVVGTGINAILNASGDSILLSDQTGDVVHKFDLDGNYLGIFAPAGGVNNAILDNIRGISLRSNGHLLVTVASGANTNTVAEFDTSGNYLGNFITAASGGLGSPWDPYSRGSDWLVTGSAGTTGILRYDLSGAFLNVLAPISTFPEQLGEAANTNVLVANFSPTSNEGVIEYTSTGTFVGRYDPTGLTGYRGVYELPGGTILTTTGTGVHEIDRSGTLVQSKITGVSGRFIEYVAPPTVCSNLADIPWVTTSPVSGTTASGLATDVTVTLDSTGLADGTYTGNLCIFSNDPDAGPGNETELVIVPVTLTVQPPTAVTVGNVAAVPLPAALPTAAVPVAGSLALLAAYWLRRKR